jgi:HD-like signal output (HDOD) protein/DNA-binding NarL/FixJ family response regulator
MARILVIDDAADIRTLVTRVLEKTGHRVAAVESADLGLAELRREAFDVVLLDMEMPGINGVACLATIRSDPALARTPVFMVTATPLREVVVCVAKLGVSGIVIKKGNWVPGLIGQVGKVVASAAGSSAETVRSEPKASSAEIRSEAVPPMPLVKERSPPPTQGLAPHSAASRPPAGPASAANAAEPWLPPDIRESDDPITSERAMEVLRTLKPIIARSELLDAMLAETVSVRALKPAAQQVLTLTGRAESSVHAVVKAIRQDQALSLRILKMANSTLYARGDRVDSVAKAVARIGLAQIRSAVLGAAVLDAFGSFSGSEGFRADWFWEHSTACGLLATRLSRAFDRPQEHCETMFTAGLLHDLGRLLYAEQLPEHYPRVVLTAERLELPLETVESRLMLLNHADITDRLLRHWNFAPAMIAPVAFHHLSVGNIRSTAPRSADDVVILALANRLAHAMLAGSSGNEVLYPIEDFVDHLRLNARGIGELLAKASDELADLRINMLMHAGESGRPFLDLVRERLGDVYPLTLAVRPEIDPMSIMAGMLRRGAGPRDANLITLRVCTPQERVAAKRLLDGAWKGAGDEMASRAPLPVLVVGDSKSCLFPEGVLSDRAVRQVTLPRGLGRLLRDMRELALVEHADA